MHDPLLGRMLTGLGRASRLYQSPEVADYGYFDDFRCYYESGRGVREEQHDERFVLIDVDGSVLLDVTLNDEGIGTW